MGIIQKIRELPVTVEAVSDNLLKVYFPTDGTAVYMTSAGLVSAASFSGTQTITTASLSCTNLTAVALSVGDITVDTAIRTIPGLSATFVNGASAVFAGAVTIAGNIKGATVTATDISGTTVFGTALSATGVTSVSVSATSITAGVPSATDVTAAGVLETVTLSSTNMTATGNTKAGVLCGSTATSGGYTRLNVSHGGSATLGAQVITANGGFLHFVAYGVNLWVPCFSSAPTLSA